MRSLRRLLNLDGAAAEDPRDTETVRRIAAQLEALPPEQARFVAAFAFVLARVARVDLAISSAERDRMRELVGEAAGLSEAQAELVVAIATTQAAAVGGTENYVVTRQFRELSSRGQRVDLLRALFAVGAADASISHAENTEISLVAGELGFDPKEVAAVRASHRAQLSVLDGKLT